MYFAFKTNKLIKPDCVSNEYPEYILCLGRCFKPNVKHLKTVWKPIDI